METIDAREFAEWGVYLSIEPMGADRAEVLSALQQAAILAPHMGKGKSPKIEDYMIDYWQERKPAKMSDKELAHRLTMFAQLHNTAQGVTDGTN